MLSSWEWMWRWNRKCSCKAINISSNILTLKWHFHFHHRHAVEQTNLLIALDHRWAYSIFMLTKCLYLVAYIFVSIRVSQFALENYRTTTWCWHELDFTVWYNVACNIFALPLLPLSLTFISISSQNWKIASNETATFVDAIWKSSFLKCANEIKN